MSDMETVSPILIPLAGIGVAIVAILAGTVQQIHSSRLKADQRMALLGRGMSPQDIEAFLRTSKEVERVPKDPMRSLGNARRTAIVLVSLGIGIIAFFVLIELILGQREIFTGAACGLIPLAIGIGFIVDYQLQKREMSRFGLEVEADQVRR